MVSGLVEEEERKVDEWVGGGEVERKWWVGWVGEEERKGVMPITFSYYVNIATQLLIEIQFYDLHSVNFSSLVHVQLIS